MIDILSQEERSKRMGLIRSSDTKPEMIVRRLIFKMGYRYRLHVSKLPGKPDIVFSRRKKAIFVHGCFWHQHKNCRNARLPKSRLDYWGPKLQKNKMRDMKNLRKLRRMGWSVLVIWECQINKEDKLAKRVRNFLEKK